MPSSGNFCILNLLTQTNSMTQTVDPAGGGLLLAHTSSAWRTTAGTFGVSSGKWYWEAYQYESLSGNGFPIGIYDMDSGLFVNAMAGDYPTGSTAKGPAYTAYSNSGSYASRYNGGTETNMSFSIGVSGDKWQCALDLDNGKIWFGKNNTWDNGGSGTGNPSTGANPSYSGGQLSDSTDRIWSPITCSYNDGSSENFVQNFGQDSTFGGRISAGSGTDGNGHGEFQYTPPTGFLALCSANISLAEAIDQGQGNAPSKFFDVRTWTGNGSTQDIDDLDFQPDIALIKNRGVADSWCNQNSTLGVGKTQALESSAAVQDETDCITAFNTDGVSLGNNHKVNANSETYVGYFFKKSADAGIDIVTYSGDGGTQSVSHSLGVTPKVIWMFLNTGSGVDSTCYIDTSSMGTSKGIFMSLSNASQSTSYVTATSSSAFSVTSSMNQSGRTYFAYLFANKPGFSHFGEYTGNNSTDGPFIQLNFQPRWFWIKRVDSASSWQSRDTVRKTSNVHDTTLNFESNTTETTNSNHNVDILSNGFKIRTTLADYNASGSAYIFGAFANIPFKYNNTF